VKLLLRANSHRRVGDGLELASSPDTPHRERWQWHLRTSAPHEETGANTVSAPLTAGTQLSLTVDPDVISADMTQIGLARPSHVQRLSEELVILVVGHGSVLLDKDHLLGELDTLVVAGDDPLDVAAVQASAEPASLVVVRLRSKDDAGVTWVP
jgi:hypothetical protein